MTGGLSIDGDIVVYRAAWATEGQSPKAAEIATLNIMDAIIRHVQPSGEVITWITHPDKWYNYRFHTAVSEPYKDRKQSRPQHYHHIREFLKDVYGAREMIGLEADDALGWHKYRGDVIATIDKDLNMVPGLQYDILKKTIEKHTPLGEVYYYDKTYKASTKKVLEFNGFKGFCCQLIIGDRSDTIPGLPYNGRSGPKSNKSPSRAFKLFAPCKTIQECWQVVRQVYGDTGCSEEYFKEQVELLWMQRFPGNTFPTKEQLNEK